MGSPTKSDYILNLTQFGSSDFLFIEGDCMYKIEGITLVRQTKGCRGTMVYEKKGLRRPSFGFEDLFKTITLEMGKNEEGKNRALILYGVELEGKEEFDHNYVFANYTSSHLIEVNHD